MGKPKKHKHQSRIQLSKKKAAKRLICAGVKLFFSGEDDLVVHLVASSASKIAIDLYEKKLPGLSLIDIYIVPEHKNDFYGIMRKNYNFLKHADRDHDEYADVENIRFQNCFELLAAIWHFSAIFPDENSLWFSFLFMYVAAKYPDWIKTSDANTPTAVALRKGRLMIGAADPDRFFRDLIDAFLKYPDQLGALLEQQGAKWDHSDELV